jgi:class 3 adenylate cyclase
MRVPIALRGPFSIPFRLIGVKASRMNPNLCTVCERFFARVYGKKQAIFPATVLFADLRGYTAMAEETASDEVVGMLDEFYDECADAIWEHDGVVNKFIGDAVLAVFNFPYTRNDHVEQATRAALDIQERWSRQGASNGAPLGIGIGIHTGQASIGEIGKACKEFTITGPVVNMASRIQGAAQSGEILVSEDVYRRVQGIVPSSEQRDVQLKGIVEPVPLHPLHA